MAPTAPLTTFRRAALAVFLTTASSAATAQNHPPQAPVITEPGAPGQTLNAADVHMETGPFADQDAGDQHLCTDWEIWSFVPNERVWAAVCATGFEKIHAHLGDGSFENSLAGWTQLLPQKTYKLRVRHRDDSGDSATEWSPWTETLFATAASTSVFALELDDVAASPDVVWTDAQSGADVDLPAAGGSLNVKLEAVGAGVLLTINPAAGPGNAITNPPPLASHDPVRVTFREIGGSAIVLPASNLTIVEHDCEAHTILLPEVQLAPNQTLRLWVSAIGATYVASPGQGSPVFTELARTLDPPFVAHQPGYSVEVFAEGLQMPVNIAVVPNPGLNAGDPFLYVTELYGAIKTVTRDGTVLPYASNLLNYQPSGAFPGAGEQGLAGIAVDAATGDVFASMLYLQQSSTYPKVVRFTSLDGGLSAATQTTILNMAGENQGQSHQISRLEMDALGTLYVHMGDGFNSSTAQDLNSFRGKILRINKDGSPYSGNPFFNLSDGVGPRDYVFAYGVRNPFGGSWRASDGLRYCVENGPSIDRLTRLDQGKNYLWSGTDQSMKNFAIHNWSPAVGPVNIAFIQPETFAGSDFPSGKFDHAFVSESGPTYASGPQNNGKRITEFSFDAAGNKIAGPIPFLSYVGDGRATIVGLAAGPDGLYFTDFYEDSGSAGPTGAGARILRAVARVPGDCDGDGNPDFCEIAAGAELDCNGNGLPDACEIASGEVTDFDSNGVPDTCDPLREDQDNVSLSGGGAVTFTIQTGAAHAGELYLLVGSASGTVPGTPIGSLMLPLNLANDPWFPLTVAFANTQILVNTLGTLGAEGDATAMFQVPANAPAVAQGVVLHHAVIVFDPQVGNQVVFVSNAVPMTFLP